MAVGDNTKGPALKPFEKTQLKSLTKSLANAKKMKDFYSGKGGDSGKVNSFQKQMDRINKKLVPLQNKGTKKEDFKKNPLKINNRGMTPSRTLAKGEEKIRKSQMNKGMPPASANPEVKKKKARRNAAGTMGQMAYGGKVKKMMGGGMAKKYKHGGKVKKCKIDGIARKGKTRAARKK